MTIPFAQSLTVEFISDRHDGLSDGLSDSKVVDAVVGMANVDGGLIFLGVSDDGTPEGLSDPTSRWLKAEAARAVIFEKTHPSVSVGWEKQNLPGGRAVVVIKVAKSLHPVACIDGRVLKRRLRRGGTPENRPVLPDEYEKELTFGEPVDFSTRIVTSRTCADLSNVERERLREHIKAVGDKTLLDLSDEDFDKALGFVRPDPIDNVLMPTFCGLLMIGKPEALQRVLPTASATFQVFEGTRLIRSVDMSLPIAASFELLMLHFRAHNKELEQVFNGQRFVIETFSEKAFRETLVNAFAHRGYALPGRVLVRMWENRLTVTSPGGFLKGITASNLIDAVPQGRNPALALAMKRAGLAESSGRGMDVILSESMRFGRLWADYAQTTDEQVIVEFLKNKEDFEFFRIINRYEKVLGRGISVVGMMILAAIRAERVAPTLDQIVGTLPSSIARERIRMELGQLEADDVVTVSGDPADPNYGIRGLQGRLPETPSGPGATIWAGSDFEPYVRDAMAAPMWNSRVHTVREEIPAFFRDCGQASTAEVAGTLEACGSSRDRSCRFRG